MSTKQTAGELYNERLEDIGRVMHWIELEIDKHKTNAEANPKDWGYPGDLGHVRERLIQTLAFLSNSEPQEIEDLLSDSR